MIETKTKRRWFRFSLRTVFMLVALVSILSAWTTYHIRWIKQRRAFRDAHPQALCNTPHQAPWQLRMFGESGYEHQGIMIDEAYSKEAKELFPEVERIIVLSPSRVF